jgi:hypothetical protein
MSAGPFTPIGASIKQQDFLPPTGFFKRTPPVGAVIGEGEDFPGCQVKRRPAEIQASEFPVADILIFRSALGINAVGDETEAVSGQKRQKGPDGPMGPMLQYVFGNQQIRRRQFIRMSAENVELNIRPAVILLVGLNKGPNQVIAVILNPFPVQIPGKLPVSAAQIDYPLNPLPSEEPLQKPAISAGMNR